MGSVIGGIIEAVSGPADQVTTVIAAGHPTTAPVESPLLTGLNILTLSLPVKGPLLADLTSLIIPTLSLPIEVTRTEADTKVGILGAAVAMNDLRDVITMGLTIERQ